MSIPIPFAMADDQSSDTADPFDPARWLDDYRATGGEARIDARNRLQTSFPTTDTTETEKHAHSDLLEALAIGNRREAVRQVLLPERAETPATAAPVLVAAE